MSKIEVIIPAVSLTKVMSEATHTMSDHHTGLGALVVAAAAFAEKAMNTSLKKESFAFPVDGRSEKSSSLPKDANGQSITYDRERGWIPA